MLVCFFALCVNLLKIAWENQVGRTLTHTHTSTQHTCTHTQNPVEWGSFFSFRSAPALPPFELASFCIHQAFHTLTHTYTHRTHRVHSKKKWLPPFAAPAAPPFGAHYTLGLSCLKIDKLILKLYKQRLSSLSLSPSPSLYLLLFSMRLFCPLYCLFHLPLANLFVAQIVLAFKAKQLLCCVFF